MTGTDLSNADLPAVAASAPALLSPCGNLPSAPSEELPAIIRRSGANATFAAKEFFDGTIRNEHTRRAQRIPQSPIYDGVR